MSRSIPESAVNRAIRLANEYGLKGWTVRLVWLEPSSGSSDPDGDWMLFVDNHGAAIAPPRE